MDSVIGTETFQIASRFLGCLLCFQDHPGLCAAEHNRFLVKSLFLALRLQPPPGKPGVYLLEHAHVIGGEYLYTMQDLQRHFIN